MTFLEEDLARILQLLGVRLMRASMIDLRSLACRTAWSVSNQGEVFSIPITRSAEDAFPGAATAIAGMVGKKHGVDHTIVRKLSPRRWAFAWHLDQHQAVIAEAQYADLRDAVSDGDTVLIRVACSVSAKQREQSASDATMPEQAAATPEIERGASALRPKAEWITVGSSAAAALLATWLALATAPRTADAMLQLHEQALQWRTTTDASMTRALAVALASGDYGDVQTELDRFGELGYFTSAVVTNAKGRVVAMTGRTDRVRIGSALPPDAAASARTLELPPGRLSIVSAPVVAGPQPIGLRLLTLAAAALAWATTALLGWRLRSGLRREAPAPGTS